LSRVSRLDAAIWAAGQLGMRGFIEALGRVHAKQGKKDAPKASDRGVFRWAELLGDWERERECSTCTWYVVRQRW
jgi:hypothetical protein